MSTAYLSHADDLPADRRAMVVARRDASWRATSIALAETAWDRIRSIVGAD